MTGGNFFLHSMDRERRSVCMFSSNFLTAWGLLVDIFDGVFGYMEKEKKETKIFLWREGGAIRGLRNASCLPPMNRRVKGNPNSSFVFSGKENKTAAVHRRRLGFEVRCGAEQ